MFYLIGVTTLGKWWHGTYVRTVYWFLMIFLGIVRCSIWYLVIWCPSAWYTAIRTTWDVGEELPQGGDSPCNESLFHRVTSMKFDGKMPHYDATSHHKVLHNFAIATFAGVVSTWHTQSSHASVMDMLLKRNSLVDVNYFLFWKVHYSKLQLESFPWSATTITRRSVIYHIPSTRCHPSAELIRNCTWLALDTHDRH